jgi:hypothetical protein
MKKTWVIIEKIIGTIITAWGMVVLFNIIRVMIDTVNSGFTTSVNVTYGQLFQKNHLNILLSLASVFAGVMLWFNDKRGWLLSIICSLLYFVTFIKSSQANSQDSSHPYFEFYKSYSLIALIFLVILIFLLQKPFWKKYQPTKKNWLWAIGIIVILLIDKFLFRQ